MVWWNMDKLYPVSEQIMTFVFRVRRDGCGRMWTVISISSSDMQLRSIVQSIVSSSRGILLSPFFFLPWQCGRWIGRSSSDLSVEVSLTELPPNILKVGNSFFIIIVVSFCNSTNSHTYKGERRYNYVAARHVMWGRAAYSIWTLQSHTHEH